MRKRYEGRHKTKWLVVSDGYIEGIFKDEMKARALAALFCGHATAVPPKEVPHGAQLV